MPNWDTQPASSAGTYREEQTLTTNTETSTPKVVAGEGTGTAEVSPVMIGQGSYNNANIDENYATSQIIISFTMDIPSSLSTGYNVVINPLAIVSAGTSTVIQPLALTGMIDGVAHYPGISERIPAGSENKTITSHAVAFGETTTGTRTFALRFGTAFNDARVDAWLDIMIIPAPI